MLLIQGLLLPLLVGLALGYPCVLADLYILTVGFSSLIVLYVRQYNNLEVSGMSPCWYFLFQHLHRLSLSANSLERIHQYCRIEQEPMSSGNEPPAAWPTTGEIVVKGLEARYWKASTFTVWLD
jgi:hypothetical protein